jgi:acetate kinase
MNKILVINSGSSTIKADVFVVEAGVPVRTAKALADKIGKADASLALKAGGKAIVDVAVGSLTVAQVLDRLLSELSDTGACRIDELLAVGHRVVHGGTAYSAAVVVDAEVVAAIDRMSVFAPLHNPANLAGIEHCRKATTVPQVAVFDTAFHQTMPAVALTYAIPRELSEKHQIRRYGFHGTSHEYVTRECARLMQIEYSRFNAISLHLGNGASACAVRNGKSVDTSMGFTPLEGLVMGTRSGDLDPSVPLFLQQITGLAAAEVESLLNKKSGLLGLSGVSDMRELLSRADAGDEHAALARDIFCARARKYLGAYLTWGKPHAVIFTGGIGENSSEIRLRIASGLEHLGITISAEENNSPSPVGLISERNSIAVFVIDTDEELMIARETLRLAQ